MEAPTVADVASVKPPTIDLASNRIFFFFIFGIKIRYVKLCAEQEKSVQEHLTTLKAYERSLSDMKKQLDQLQ